MFVLLYVIDDLDLVEDDTCIEHIKRRVVECTAENDILEILEPVRVVYLSLDVRVIN